jgi:hypothetical protein
VTGRVIATHPPLAGLSGRIVSVGATPADHSERLNVCSCAPAVQVGTRIEFPNLDDTYHNIFLLTDETF